MGMKKLFYGTLLKIVTTKEFRSFMSENQNAPRVEFSRRGGVKIVNGIKE